MPVITFYDLKDRVEALYRHVTQDSTGGYQETWEKHQDLWARVTLHKYPNYDVVVRACGDRIMLQGFHWKNLLLRVTEHPIHTECRRFIILKTGAEKRRRPRE